MGRVMAGNQMIEELRSRGGSSFLNGMVIRRMKMIEPSQLIPAGLEDDSDP